MAVELPRVRRLKSVIHRPTVTDQLLHRSNQKRSVYYHTTGRPIDDKVLQQVTVAKNDFSLPLLSRPSIPHQAVEKAEKERLHEEEFGLRVSEKSSRRTRFADNIAERLFVTRDDDVKPKQNLDVQFNDAVIGRPQYEKFGVKTYIDNLRKSRLINVRKQYLQDEIALIDKKYHNENKLINKISAEYKKYYATFKEYEANNREMWYTVRRYLEDMVAKTNEKKNQLKQLMKESSRIKRALFVLEERWKNCKMCRIFLYEISPKNWREGHRYSAGENDFNLMEERYKLDAERSFTSLHSLIEVVKEHNESDTGPLELYFTDPKEINQVFAEMEQQHTNTMLTIEAVMKNTDAKKRQLIEMRDYYYGKIKACEEDVANIEGMIEFEEERARQLEDLATELTNTDFKNVVLSKAAITSTALVEHAYSSCIADDGNDIKSLGKLEALKLLYEYVMLRLDELPVEAVRRAEREVEYTMTRAVEEAVRAQRNVAALDGLTKRMQKSLEKPFVKKSRRPLMVRSEPPHKEQKKAKPQKSFTVEELEYFLFFTDQCEYDDEYMKLFLPFDF